MNEQGAKKITFNKSTLLSLKAELLKKQEEVQEKKQLPQSRSENHKPPLAVKTSIDNSEPKKSFKDCLKAIDVEELESCRKSKLILEKKAELYEHLSDGVGNSQLAGRFLVDFDTKKKQEPKCLSPPVQEAKEDNHYSDNENDDEWIEFTDCLGRTRKCLKSDIDFYKQRDQDLHRAVTKYEEQSSSSAPPDLEEHETTKEKPLLVQKTKDYLLSLRQKWEEKEKELVGKDKDLHYQDLLFDEARIHGVGYYSFSTDEAERRKQMEELIRTRQETLKMQQETEAKRKQREQLIAARVAAARARQRLRAGLPPEDPEEKKKEFNDCLLKFLTQQKDDAEAKAKEEERKTREEREKERQLLREAHVRDWDIGKEGVEERVKKFKEMTQEEYVEQQRSKRINEFAPLNHGGLSTSKTMFGFDDHGKKITPEEPSIQKSWSEVRPRPNTPPPPDIADNSTEEKGLYFSTSKKSKKVKPYRSYVKETESTPIVNEVSDDEFDIKPSNEKSRDTNHAEIEPPPTYEYYGPVAKQPRQGKPFNHDIAEAYAKGAKSLEKEPTNRKLPKHYDFTFD